MLPMFPVAYSLIICPCWSKERSGLQQNGT